MLALVSFWTSPPKQQPGIVIEQLNDDENEWKGRYEFPACRHSHTSQVWFQEQLCGFKHPPPPFFCTHKHTFTHLQVHTLSSCACVRIETHKQELLFNGRPKTLEAVYCCATGKPTNLSIPDLLYTSDLASLCVRMHQISPPQLASETMIQLSYQRGPLIIICLFHLALFEIQQILINSCNFSVKRLQRVILKTGAEKLLDARCV